jgi:hypothetical protein
LLCVTDYAIVAISPTVMEPTAYQPEPHSINSFYTESTTSSLIQTPTAQPTAIPDVTPAVGTTSTHPMRLLNVEDRGKH